MISTGFEQRVKTQQIINNQLPEFILDESPKISEFLKQYYISQEYQGGPSDIAENIDQYLKFDNLTPEVISGETSLISNISSSDKTISVSSTKTFPKQYGLLKIDDEIITYTGIEGNKFTGCIRGFSAITSYKDYLNPEELVFSDSIATSHSSGSKVINLSTLFLREFYKKLKYIFAPGFENYNLQKDLNVNNFIKQIRDFYNAKGTDESFKILFKVLYGVNPKILNLENFLIKPSDGEYIKRKILIGQLISKNVDPNNLVGEEIKSSDGNAFGPISEIEIVTRNNKSFYKIYLFNGYNEDSIFGTFKITPKTKVSDNVSIGSSSITVDSTVGFDSSGTIIFEGNSIKYKEKSINQFLGCSGVSKNILQGSEVYSTPTIYGYENGDENKKVEFILISSLNNVENFDKINYFEEKDQISFSNFGESISPKEENLYKRINFNSWIYNVRSRYEVKNYNVGGFSLTLYDIPDKSSLKINDYVDIVKQNSFELVVENALIRNIDFQQKTVQIDKQILGITGSQKISIIRKYEYANSRLPFKYPKILSNVQNTYNENDEFVRVASNSLPSFNITKNIEIISKNIQNSTDSNLFFSGFNQSTQKYSVLSFSNNVPFITGDLVKYTHTTSNPINGLVNNTTYVVEVLNEKNKIRLYIAPSFIPKNDYIEFDKSTEIGSHTFTLLSHFNKKLDGKKSFIKIPLSPKDDLEITSKTTPGIIGSLINGVHILNYKSDDKIYYGPLESIRVVNSGNDYDVLYPPPIVISNPVGLGTTALANTVVSGSLKEVIVDPNDVAVERVLSATLSGGNGRGALLQPILSQKNRELSFNGSNISIGGGIDPVEETITFTEQHRLKVSDKIIYNNNGNASIGVGTYKASNTDQERYLSNGAIYYPQIVNSSTIRLYNNLSDLNLGINTVGFTTINNGGIHKFRIYDTKKILKEIRVINGGQGYENRILRINPTGISTVDNFIQFKNHGFSNGELINYSYINSPITGISSLKNYYIINASKDKFQLSDAEYISVGISKTDYNRGKIVELKSKGEGYQIFSYPPIKVNLDVEYSGFIGTIVATPILRGKIVDAYLYENGSNYGSEVLNLHKKPKIEVKLGYGAQLKPIIINGKIVAVQVQSRGIFYSQSVELNVIGNGIGASLRPVIVNGKIQSVVVINGGIGYSSNLTSITVKTPGYGAFIDSSVRSLTVNNYYRFGDEVLLDSRNSSDNLTYNLVGYSTEREGFYFEDLGSSHSKIIGWSIDGNPIYGPFAYKNPSDFTSSISVLKSGYILNPSLVNNRPSQNSFPPGFFVEDYVFDNSGDLDENNGRFAKTPEFPNGTYAYYASVDTDLISGSLKPQFPYFIGENYRSKIYSDYILEQDNDLNLKSLIRNTYPYRVTENYSKNDFLPTYNNRLKQTSSVETILPGKIEDVKIINPGNNYSVGDYLIFDNNETNGGGCSIEISEIIGKEVVNLNTTYEQYENSVIEWKNKNTLRVNILPSHNLLNNDLIEISGISSHIKNLSKSHRIKIESKLCTITSDIPSSSGIVTDIYLNNIPENISIGSSLTINQETFLILNKFNENSILRVKRTNVGTSHTSGNLVTFLPSYFDINIDTDYFKSNINNIVYFNPNNSIGVGTLTGSSINLNYDVGNSFKSISVPIQSIYLPNHPFKTNQLVKFSKPSGSSGILVSNTSNGSTFNIFDGANSKYCYVINKSKDYIGIVTQVGLTTTDGLYFANNGSSNFEYSFTYESEKIIGTVEKIKTLVSTASTHGLTFGDTIKLNINSFESVGVGTSLSIKVIYNSDYNLLLTNPIGFNSSFINSEKNQIVLNSHNLYTGQKIFYTYNQNPISGLSTGIYYVYKISNNIINLGETYNDVISSPPNVVSFGNTGGSNQSISLINPTIFSIKNNNLVFDLSDSSLRNFEFSFYRDKNLTKEFISIGNSSNFNVEKINTIGISTDALCKLNYDVNFPNKLYYSLKKNGKSIFQNNIDNDYKIEFIDSLYNGEYQIFGIGSTTFSISLKKVPEKLTYKNKFLSVISYVTKSKSAKGPVGRLTILNTGDGYTKLPSIVGVNSSSSGENAVFEINSYTIGRPGTIKIINDGYEYSSDNTLRPFCRVPSFAILKNSQRIKSIKVVKGGQNYISVPNIKLINSSTKKEVRSGYIKPILTNNTISEIQIINPPYGLDPVKHNIFTVNNSNGISVVGISSYSYETGIVECTLRTPPIYGFKNPPFKPGDLIFVEGLQKKSFTDELGNVTSPGDGFNSEDHDFNFFEVTEFINSDPAIVKYNIGKYTSFAGIQESTQTVFSTIVNFKNYPFFEVNQEYGKYYKNETLIVNNVKTDIVVENSSDNGVKFSNTNNYKIKQGDSVGGSISGNYAVVNKVFDYSARYSIDSSNDVRIGWKNDSGKLNLDVQVIPDNDYYQNLSYSIQSPIEYNTFIGPVNSIVHPIGIKNFADTGITSSSKVSIGSSELLLTTLDFIDEKRVDTVNIFDFTVDYDTKGNSSEFIKLKNKKLSNYIQCNTNRVLQIDDISNIFSSSEFDKDVFLELSEYPITDLYSKFLVQVSTEDKSKYQISEIVILNDLRGNTYTLDKVNLFTNESLGTFNGDISDVGNPVLKFNPTDPYNTSYQLKVYRERFSQSPSNIGLGFTDYGCIRLSAKTENLTSTVGVSTVLFRGLTSQFDVVYSNSLVINTDDNESNYYEVIGYYDGTNTHISEFYFDSSDFASMSGPNIGTFGLTVNNQILNLSFTNNTNKNLLVRTKTVGFANTNAGIGTYRFDVEGQIPGTERTTRLESNFKSIVGVTTIKIFDGSIESSLKSLIKVSIGSTVALHQVLVVTNQNESNIQSYPFLSIGSTSGIGTFSVKNKDFISLVEFYPDQQFSSTPIKIQSFDQYFYADYDEFNEPENLTYGTSIENIEVRRYGSINNYGKDRLNFNLNYNRIPIFKKIFNPKNSNILELETGIFTINNHFFETGEELIYAANSSLIDVSSEPIGIGTTLVGGSSLIADIISGFSTITGISTTVGISTNQIIFGPNISQNTQIISIGQTYSYFIGNVVSTGSTVITGIANTELIKIGAGIFSGNNDSLGTVVRVGINSLTLSSPVEIATDRLYYSNTLNPSLTLSNVSSGTTFRSVFSSGISTDKCPSKVYAIKIDNNKFKITGVSGSSGIAFTFTSTGSGNLHSFEMKKKLEKSLITVDGVNQYPLTYTPLTFTLSNNLNGSVGIGTSFISLSGISSIQPKDIIKINDEYVTINNVGFGTTSIGPITNLGPFSLVEVNRGALGSAESTHSDGTQIRIYKGSYNIVGNEIWFSEAPDGKGRNDRLNELYLPIPKSTFNGRVFLRKDYTGNQIYDDISHNFTGIARTFTLYKNGNNVPNVIAGNNLVFINDVFQTPDTINNSGNNYKIISSSGISSVSFTGITIPNTDNIFTVDSDVNQNQIPRGGLVVSIASTGGIGYAPLVGIPTGMLEVKIGTGGSITEVGFTTSLIVGYYKTGTIGINSNAITGINTSNIKVNQRLSDIPGVYLPSLVSKDIILPDTTKILQFGTIVSSIGIGTVYISKLTTNSTSITTSFGFDIGPTVGSGYNQTVSVAITDKLHTGSPASITASVGVGGSLGNFKIISGGSNYVNPIAYVSDPSYSNLPIKGLTRPGIGNTDKLGVGLSMSIDIGPSTISVGIGSTLFGISGFEITKPGYGFLIGDTFTLSGIVTDSRLTNPLEELIFTVVDVRTDSFASWQLGEFDYIDSIKLLQDGKRTRFPLYKDDQLLSFEKNINDINSSLIDFDTVLLIFVNGVMQEPKVSYIFEGGTTFTFNEPPRPEDNIAIFFYRGTINQDSEEVNVIETIKVGDTVQINKNDYFLNSVGQESRIVSFIVSSDITQTGIYLEDGIDEVNYKPLSWTKQKRDLIINDNFEFKQRDSLEPLVFPTAKIIKSVENNSTEIFVDNAEFFKYEQNESNEVISKFSGLITLNENLVFAKLKANVSSSGTISSINILDGGNGYIGVGTSVRIKTRSITGLGGTNAIIDVSVSSSGTITEPIYIINPGYGYSQSNPPEIIVPLPDASKELISDIRFAQGFSGIITGITTSSGIGTDLGLKFFVKFNPTDSIDDLVSGYPIFVFDTIIGNGVTSINTNNNQIVGIGTTFLDNIYYAHSVQRNNLNGVIISNVLSTTDISGLSTSKNICGRFSWGRLSGYNRSINPISINLSEYTVNSGLTSFPTIQRRTYGLRDTGALKKGLEI